MHPITFEYIGWDPKQKAFVFFPWFYWVTPMIIPSCKFFLSKRWMFLQTHSVAYAWAYAVTRFWLQSKGDRHKTTSSLWWYSMQFNSHWIYTPLWLMMNRIVELLRRGKQFSHICGESVLSLICSCITILVGDWYLSFLLISNLPIIMNDGFHVKSHWLLTPTKSSQALPLLFLCPFCCSWQL